VQIVAPGLLQGNRCYVDASIAPDQTNQLARTAGLGIFFLNLQDQVAGNIYIKARLNNCSSVLMAEAAELALASAIAHRLSITQINYLSDNQ
jgi:hypothetical protein